MTKEEEEEKEEEGLQDMLQDFFGDILSSKEQMQEGDDEDAHASRRQECEKEIRERCNEMLYDGAKVSKLRTMLGLLNLQSIYGWSDASDTALFQLLKQILPYGNCMLESCTAQQKKP